MCILPLRLLCAVQLAVIDNQAVDSPEKFIMGIRRVRDYSIG
jgi:hypothetical protein